VKKALKKEIRIYIEGAERGKEEARLREGFRTFLDELYQLARQKGFRFHPPIMCGASNDAYRDFKKAIRSNRDALNFLLVDSEKPVAENVGPWTHLNCDSLGLDDSQRPVRWFAQRDGEYEKGQISQNQARSGNPQAAGCRQSLRSRSVLRTSLQNAYSNNELNNGSSNKGD
jgi:hypothetical protein